MNDFEINKVLKKYYDNCISKKQVVTVFLTTHKRPHYLSLMIESVLKQTYSNFYLIVLDNMSNDETKQVVNSFADDRIVYIERESSITSGISNFMFSFLVCKTEFLAVFHDDDVVHEDYLEKMLKIMQENNSYCCLSCNATLIDKDGNVFSQWNSIDGIETYSGTQYFDALYHGTKPCCHLFPTILYRHSFYIDILQILDRYVGPCLDEYLYLQSERYGGTTASYNEILYDYRIHGSQDSSIYRKDMAFTLFKSLVSIDYYCLLFNSDLNNVEDLLLSTLFRELEKYKSGNINTKEKNTFLHICLKRIMFKSKKQKKIHFLFIVSRFFPRTVFTFLSKNVYVS